MANRKRRFPLLNAALIAVVFSFGASSLSQTMDQAQPRLLGSYGNPQPSCELAAALDYLANVLTEDVEDVAYVIVYRGYNNTSAVLHLAGATVTILGAPRYGNPGIAEAILAMQTHLSDLETRLRAVEPKGGG